MRTMLITGANRGIGLEFVRQYAADGWRVVACCRKPAAAEALNRLAAQYPDQVTVHALDVTDHAQIDQLAQTLSEQPIDLLINNAGVYPPARSDALGETDYAAWQQAFAVNTMAPLKITEAFIQQIARSEFKTIVTITSTPMVPRTPTHPTCTVSFGLTLAGSRAGAIFQPTTPGSRTWQNSRSWSG